MNNSLPSINHTIYFGFIGILLLLLTLGGLGLHHISSANQAMTKIVEDNNAKIEFANAMRESIRLRQSSMNLMLSMTDTFERDDERMEFYAIAKLFREARQKLFQLPMTPQEKNLHQEITTVTQRAQPLNNIATELLIENTPPEIVQLAVHNAKSEQQNLLDLLTELIDLQKKYARDALLEQRARYDQSLLTVVLLGIFGALVALVIVNYITRYVSAKNDELVAKNQELAVASIQALAATNTKSAFLATMSHEIRTPLTAIIGYAEASLEQNFSMLDRVTSIKTIVRSGKHLLQIINDILDISKIEANKLETENISCNPFEIVSDISSLISGHTEEKGLNFDIIYQFPLPKMITSDPLRLKQILLNLCSNAVKFTEKGNINIELAYDQSNNELKFDVIDTGIGLTADQCLKIFDAFTQADSTTARQYGGTGLGLSLSKELAERLGGTIIVESTPKLGSRFTLTINPGEIDIEKLAQEKNDLQLTKIQNKKPTSSFSLKGNILLAEDNLDNQRLLSLFIRNMGSNIKVDIAENGKVAVQMALSGNYDLIFMDMQMPIMGGIEAVNILRGNSYGKPIIALTANAMEQDKEKCIKAGCNDFVTKPIDRTQLYATAAKYLFPEESTSIDTPIISSFSDQPEYDNIISLFVNSLPNIALNLQYYTETNEWENMGKLMHQLRSNSGGLGFTLLSEIAGNLEFQIVSERYNEVNELAREINCVIKRIIFGHQANSSLFLAANG